MTLVWRGVTSCILGTMLLMTVVTLNRYPFFFNDTRSYVRQPALIIKALTKINLVADWPSSSDQPQAAAAGSTAAGADVKTQNNGITANRSIYYGLLALLGYVTGNFWVTVLIQSAWIAVALYLLVSLSEVRVGRIYIPSMVITSTVSCAGFYTGYIMPDIFAPVLIIATCCLLLYYDKLSRGQLVFVVASIVFAVLAHPSHQVILVALTLLFLAWAWFARIIDLTLARPVWLIVGCIVVGVLGQVAFNKGLELYSGEKPLLLPHIEAHLIDMGPGTDYAKHACDPQRFAVCRYKDMFPMFWETFLGNADPSKGVFAAADFDTKRRLSDEQLSFAFAVFRYDPIGLCVGLVRDAIAQLFKFSLNDFVIDQLALDNYNTRFPPAVARHIAEATSGQSPGIVEWASNVYIVVVVVAVASLVYLFARYRRLGQAAPGGRNVVRVAGFLLAGVVVNGLVCGFLASPYDRFQARVIWLVVFAAALMATSLIADRTGPARRL